MAERTTAYMYVVVTTIALLQMTSSCPEGICLRANDLMADEKKSAESKAHLENEISLRRGFVNSIGHNEVISLSECPCKSETSCLRKCCPLDSVLNKETRRCIEDETFTGKGTKARRSSRSVVNNYVASSNRRCFGDCPSGEELYIYDLSGNNSAYLTQKSGEICASHGNDSFCLKPDGLCIDYVSSPRGLVVASCRNATATNVKTLTWKGYHYPSHIMPKMIATMLFISSLSLTGTFLVYSCFRELRSLHGNCLLCHMASLIVYYLIVIIRRFRSVEMRHDGWSCLALDVSRYYFYLAPFSWLNVTCFDISMSFMNLRHRHIGHFGKTEWMKFACYSLYSWTTPVAALIASFHIDLSYKGIDFSHIDISKWCSAKHFSSSYYRYIPMSVYMGISVALFVTTAIKINRINTSTSILRSDGQVQRNAVDKDKRFKLYAKLLVVMGFLSWVMEPIFWTVHEWMIADRTDYRSTVWFFMLIIRNLQGLFISVVFLWNEKVRKLVKKAVRKNLGWLTSGSGSRSHEMSSISRLQSSQTQQGPL
ncbi:probable G-protein coupled receptor Mth-like 4 [Ischnura elegans]|uniref:probable G-protein coupled receptor Mth-like 4 n=1 Tax=Ischnura elegans TaxID=197161 RepID=UPI001ED8A2BD|nr:probable G-protein coupled receptor Mth-like 4 [Ischnura elegans]